MRRRLAWPIRRAIIAVWLALLVASMAAWVAGVRPFGISGQAFTAINSMLGIFVLYYLGPSADDLARSQKTKNSGRP